jgi:hypothetical protein
MVVDIATGELDTLIKWLDSRYGGRELDVIKVSGKDGKVYINTECTFGGPVNGLPIPASALAGGDLVGTYPNPLLRSITAPANGSIPINAGAMTDGNGLVFEVLARLITGQDANNLIFRGAPSAGTGASGNIELNAGVGVDANGGHLFLAAGSSINQAGGNLSLNGGTGLVAGGNVSFYGGAGTGPAAPGGPAQFIGGNSASGVGGALQLFGGSSGLTGGEVLVRGGDAVAGNGGSVNVDGGTSTNAVAGIVGVGTDPTRTSALTLGSAAVLPNTTTGYAVGGTKVVGAQAVAVADAAGGAIVDAECRAALNSLLAKLRAHGMIAT